MIKFIESRKDKKTLYYQPSVDEGGNVIYEEMEVPFKLENDQILGEIVVTPYYIDGLLNVFVQPMDNGDIMGINSPVPSSTGARPGITLAFEKAVMSNLMPLPQRVPLTLQGNSKLLIGFGATSIKNCCIVEIYSGR